MVFPLKDGNYMVRPPVVQIYIGNNTENPTVRNVLTYPLTMPKIGDGDLKESAKSVSGATYFEHSLSFNETSVNKENEKDKVDKKGYFNVKRYVVTSVSIEDLENTNGWNYNVNTNIPGTKRGFIVTLSLSETTRNFLDLVPDFKAYYDVWIKPNNSLLLKEKEYVKNKLFYNSQDTNELSEDLKEEYNKQQSDLNDAKKKKKIKEKTSKKLKKDIKKNQQKLDKINNNLKTLSTSDPDYEILKGAKLDLENKINSDEDEKKVLQKEIGSLDSKIGGLKTNIRNISSAMKTLTLGAY